jgi:UDP-2,4-diacetamido-2,4,6-trideoxy-beta-L-altropyranose hydrolase
LEQTKETTKKMPGQIIIRADAAPLIGAGHLMRCLALAQALRTAGYSVTFIAHCQSKSLHQRLLDGGFQVIPLKYYHPAPVDWQTTSEVLQSFQDPWLVLDGYHFDSAYQRQIKDGGHRLLVIDDMAHLDRYYADIVVNQNLNAQGLDYAAEPFTRFLLGPRYALLRPEFLNWLDCKRRIPPVAQKVLITLGGGDDQNQTLRVMRALQNMPIDGLEAAVVVGPANPHLTALKSEAGQSQFPIRLAYNAANMPELMGWADLAISAGGSTCWELAFMGVPTLAIILADNQQAIAEGLEEEGVAVNLGGYGHLSNETIARKLIEIANAANTRAQMSQRGRKLIDGQGTARVLKDLLLK